jgi:hypothetical protein
LGDERSFKEQGFLGEEVVGGGEGVYVGEELGAGDKDEGVADPGGG